MRRTQAFGGDVDLVKKLLRNRNAARFDGRIESPVGCSLQVELKIQLVGGKATWKPQFFGIQRGFYCRLQRIAAGVAAAAQTPGQTEIEARQRGCFNLPCQTVTGKTIGATETGQIAGQIQIDIGIDQMLLFITDTAAALDRPPFEFSRRQGELGKQP